MPSASEIRAGAAYVELYARTNPLVRGLKSGERLLTGWGRRIQRMGMMTMAAGSAIVTPILWAAKSFAAAGDQLHKMSLRTGASVEMLSALSHAAAIGGTELESIEKAMKRQAKTANDYQRGLSTAVEAYDALGISAVDAEGNLKKPEALFKETIAALSGLENHTQKAALAQELFGRAGTQLLPMLHDGEEGMVAVMEEAERLGLILSKEDAEAAAQLTDAMTRLQSVLSMVWKRVGAAVAPMLSDLADRMAEASSKAIDWVKANQPLIVLLLKIGAGLMAVGAGLMVLGPAVITVGAGMGMLASMITMAGAAVGVLGTVLAALLSPIGMVTAAVIALGSWWLHTTGRFRAAGRWLGGVFGQLRDDAVEAFGGIMDALKAGDWQAAVQVLWSLLKLEWTKGVNWLMDKWAGFRDSFLDVWNEATTGLAMMFNSAVAGLQKIWVNLSTFMVGKFWEVALEIQKAMAQMMPDWMAKRLGINKQWHGFAAGMAQKATEIAIEQEKAKRLKAIDEERAQREEILAGDLNRKQTARDDRRAAQMARRQREAADAQAAFDNAVAAARRRRAEGPGAPGIREQYGDIMGGAAAAGKSGVLAASSTAMLKYLSAAVEGGGTAEDRTADATEGSEEQLKKINQSLQTNKLVWVGTVG